MMPAADALALVLGWLQTASLRWSCSINRAEIASRYMSAPTAIPVLRWPTLMANQSQDCRCVRLQQYRNGNRSLVELSLGRRLSQGGRMIMNSVPSKIAAIAIALVMLFAVAGCSGQP